MWNRIVVAAAALCLATSAQAAPRHPDAIESDGVASADQAQVPEPSSPPHDHSQHQGEPPAASGRAQGHGATAGMAQKHAGMMATMAADQAKLETLMAQMTAATGEAKIDAMAQVVGELVRQKHAMHQHMSAMHEHMSKMDQAMCGTMMQHK